MLYTSGTTGRPKGCILTNGYFRGFGEWYAAQRGYIALAEGAERLLQPLPTFHINAMANSFMGMLYTGGAQVILDRFHPREWWAEAVETRATCFHYLGVMPAMLLALPAGAHDRAHGLRFGMGGGVQPAHHAAFEARFGVRLLEGWAMTETGGGGIMCAMAEPRHVGARCIGRPDRAGPPMEARVVDEDGNDVAADVAGELLVRARGPDPRRRFFAGYLKDAEATAAAWAGGWLHTGDVVRRDAHGSFFFVDRRKNIIRRSGENISAVEVEAVLAAHPAVRQVGVLAVADAIREEEVMAVVALHDAAQAGAALADALFEHCRERLAYYKAPGYVAFVASLPTTATQKVRKSALGELARAPDRHPDCFDLRERKRRDAAARRT
ncbi:MAG: AMP-binding protein [Burkholderiales bacterium]|nr:AMP-binding protein [Burkholderiales bacterium]